MTNSPQLDRPQLDSAALFACALSLWQAFQKRAVEDLQLNLSEAYNGMDQFMREVMRVASLFEAWACDYVEFEEMSEVWPYLMQEKFGCACLESILPDGLAKFDANDCLRVALRLRLPMGLNDKLRIPVDVRAPNPIAGSGFLTFRIQTVRNYLESEDVAPFTTGDDPFNEEFGAPYFALYGVAEDGLLEHIADRRIYSDALSLADRLAPGVAFPNKPICFTK
jgi:hypothetical protein